MSNAISRLFQMSTEFSLVKACPRWSPTAELYNTRLHQLQSKSFVFFVFISSLDETLREDFVQFGNRATLKSLFWDLR